MRSGPIRFEYCLVRHFAPPPVLLKALAAGTLGGAAALPRLYLWQDRTDAVWFLAGMLGWCLFMLWGFVFAWEPIYGQAKPFTFHKSAKVWGILTLSGVAAAAVLHVGLDPTYRPMFPKEYPNDPEEWIAFTLFNLSHTDLFLCFAPMAFFARLIPNATWVMGLTIGFNLLVLGLKASSGPDLSPALVIIALSVYRLADATAAVLLYRWGGVWPVWYLTVLLNLRHVFQLGA